MVLVDGMQEDGLYTLINGKPVPISTLSESEYLKANGPPPTSIQVSDATLQEHHLRLPSNLHSTYLLLMNRPNTLARQATPEAISAFVMSFWKEQWSMLSTLRTIDTSTRNPLGDLPLIVLSRGRNSSPDHQRHQADLARLSTRSTHVVVKESDHEIHLFQPEVVVKAIRDVAAVR
jgi:hypothetical protein